MEQNHMPVRSRPAQPDDQQRPHHADSKTLLHAQNAFPADGPSGSAQQPEPPSSQPSHEPIAATSFPETPTTELPPIQPRHERTSSASNHSLPSLSSVTSGLQPKPESRPAPTQWPSLNPYTVFYSPGYAKPAETSRADADRSAASPEQYYDRRSGSVSLDDPDVRMAAEALGDLRADFVSSSPNRRTPLPTPPRDQRMATSTPPNAVTDRPQPEPLLSLITASHPLLATTIEGATSAYNQSKNYSPHLKTGAEYVEGYLTPVAKTINNIGQKTGVHTSVRWFLGSRRQGRKHQSTTDLETGERGIHKRRKARASEASDVENRPVGLRTPELPNYISDRRTSVSTVDTFDTLPAYDDARSPAYAEVVSSGAPQSELEWKTKIVVSTSSLGVALRDNNLRSLRYCLEGLRSANAYLSNRLASLQAAIEEYDATKEARDGDDDVMADASANRDGLVVRINALKNDIVMRISTAIKLVSDYAGGALPDNAKHLIHQQLLSLPGRLLHLSREASSGPPSGNAQDASMREGANRVTLLAKEGLQVITQVSDVIDRTIKSAEEWLETLGRGSGVQAGSLPDRTREKAPATAQWATTQSQFAAPLADENHQMTDRG